MFVKKKPAKHGKFLCTIWIIWVGTSNKIEGISQFPGDHGPLGSAGPPSGGSSRKAAQRGPVFKHGKTWAFLVDLGVGSWGFMAIDAMFFFMA